MGGSLPESKGTKSKGTFIMLFPPGGTVLWF